MREKLTRVAVRAIICDDLRRVLIIKRSNTNYGNGKWCLPGGKVDYGISVLQNLANEIREETTLELQEAEFVCYLDTLPSTETDMHFVSLVFQCKVSGQVSLNEESQKHTWISHDQIKDYQLTFDNEKGLEIYWKNNTSVAKLH